MLTHDVVDELHLLVYPLMMTRRCVDCSKLPEQPAMPHATTETSARTPLAPVSSGYADVNGIKLYHEIYGQGEPLVLLHGGLMTIGEMSRPPSIRKRSAGSSSSRALTPRVVGTPRRRKAWARSAPPWPNT